jgi:hypothetical protein
LTRRAFSDKGIIERLYASPPANSVVICIDEMGPLSVRSYPGRELVHAREGDLAGRAKWELQLDRDRKFGGYVFGSFVPTTGEALTATYASRSISAFVDFLEKVEAWVPEDADLVYAIMDNLRAHKAYDVLLFSLAHTRWEFVFQPKYAAYLNLIEPWWKTLRSMALQGRNFETWEQIEEAIAKAKDYWNERRHPYVWGRRRRHRPTRRPGVGAMPTVRSTNG